MKRRRSTMFNRFGVRNCHEVYSFTYRGGIRF